ncbi:hypothetical protein J4225_00680 [Candidatus Pacearchaeota archaeon]|nr:hypothetical protein [Candidatus Pacearchaeota archaeon]
MDKQFELYDPHPGSKGALMPLPKEMQDVAKRLNGKRMTLEEALAQLEPFAKKTCGKVEAVFKYSFISYIQGPHHYRLLRFKELVK